MFYSKYRISRRKKSRKMKMHRQEYKMKVTDFDAARLRALMLAARNSSDSIEIWLNKLHNLLKNVVFVNHLDISPDRITMNSKIKLRDNDRREEMAITLVFPADVLPETGLNFEEYKVSILTPMGLAVLGRKVGDKIVNNVIVEEMLYQPEASGDYDL